MPRPWSVRCFRQHALRILLGAVIAIACQGCADEGELPSTQLTVRLHASQEVLDQMTGLRVQVFAGDRQSDVGTRSYGKDKLLKWPVDIQVLPTGPGNVRESIEVVAAVLAHDSRTIVEQRALSSTVPGQQRVLDIVLERCGTRPLGTLCETRAGCRGAACLSCVRGSCEATPRFDGIDLPPLDPTASPAHKGTGGNIDAGIDAGPTSSGDGGAGGLSCSDHQYWYPVFSSGPVPPNATVFAMPLLTPPDSPPDHGPRNQFICRAQDAMGGYTNGKANGKLDGFLDYGCYFSRFDQTTGTWVGDGVDQRGDRFEILAPPPQCKLSWIPASAARPLPANALVVTRDSAFRPQFACRVEVNAPESSGMHIGRVNQNLGDPCRVQFFGSLLERTEYEILVQDAPML